MVGVFENVLEKYGLPSEAAGACRVCLSGMNHVRIENCRGLLEYSGECIVVECKREKIRICGEKLIIIAMKREELIIGGKIISLELE